MAGCIVGLFSCFPVIHLIVGLGIILGGMSSNSNSAPPVLFGLFFVVIALIFIVIGWGIAVCILLAGMFLSKRKNYTFFLVVAGVECMFMPFGTVLGVFTLIVLTKEPVKQLFSQKSEQDYPAESVGTYR